MEDFFGFLVIPVIVLGLMSSLTLDSDNINLKTVQYMTEKCKDNGGLSYIEHDYDVKCRNEAEFSYDRLHGVPVKEEK